MADLTRDVEIVVRPLRSARGLNLNLRQQFRALCLDRVIVSQAQKRKIIPRLPRSRDRVDAAARSRTDRDMLSMRIQSFFTISCDEQTEAEARLKAEEGKSAIDLASGVAVRSNGGTASK